MFYLCNVPKSSILELNVVEDIVMERYKRYMSDPAEYDTSQEYDSISHFLVCLIASRSTWLHEIIVKGEAKILSWKLQNISVGRIKEHLNCTVKFLDSIHQIPTKIFPHDINIIRGILNLVKDKAKHVFNKNHHPDCQKYQMILPFRLALNLVAARKVEMSLGKVSVSCGKWKYILENMFTRLLEFEIEFYKNLEALQYKIYESEDDRLRSVIENCIRNMSGNVRLSHSVIKAVKIDEECQYFPPCMANLHQLLRKTHRLSYDSRYQYTLFLKDIGMPVVENLLFWKNEYKKPHESSSCTHYWDEKMERYKYQIQHMYGLIGSRTFKSSHSCQKFIGKLNLKMDAGCPFSQLDEKSLQNCLPKDFSEIDIEDILCCKNEPQKACAAYFNNQFKLRKGNSGRFKKKVTEILSPLQYYNLAKQMDI